MMKKSILLIAAIALITIIMVQFILGEAKSNGEMFEYVEAATGGLENIVSSTGTIEALNTVEIGTQVSGIINNIFVDFNDNVKKDQTLAVLDTAVLAARVMESESNLLRAQAQYDQALAEYERNKPLFEKGFISEKEFVPIKTNLQVTKSSVMSAEVDLERSKINRSYAEIKSPIDGVVVHRSVEPGQTVAASFQTPTMFIVAEDLSRMQILASVDESDIGMIRQGQPARFTVQAYMDEEFSGMVRQIRLQPTTEQNVVNYTVVVDASNEDGKLLPGMTATVDFIVDEVSNATLIPNTAIRFQPPTSMMQELRTHMKQSNAGRSDKAGRSGSGTGRGMGMRGGEMPKDVAVLWYLDESGNPAVKRVRTSVTDGINTAIQPGQDVHEGMKFIKSLTEYGKSVFETESTQEQPRRGPRIF